MLAKKKVEQFLKINFPDFVKYDITENTDDYTMVILDYGKDKMRIKLQQSEDYKLLIRLIDTQFLT